MPRSSSKKKSGRKNTNSCFSRISASIISNNLLQKSYSLKDKIRAKAEIDTAVAELAGEETKPKAKVLMASKVKIKVGKKNKKK